MKINVNFPPNKKPLPPIVFLGNPLPKVTPLIAGYFLGSVTGICLMDYLMYLSMKNRVEVVHHHHCGCEVIND